MFSQDKDLWSPTASPAHRIDSGELLGEVHHEGDHQLLSVHWGADLRRERATFPTTHFPVRRRFFLFFFCYDAHQRKHRDSRLPVCFFLFPLHLLQLGSRVVVSLQTKQTCSKIVQTECEALIFPLSALDCTPINSSDGYHCVIWNKHNQFCVDIVKLRLISKTASKFKYKS